MEAAQKEADKKSAKSAKSCVSCFFIFILVIGFIGSTIGYILSARTYANATIYTIDARSVQLPQDYPPASLTRITSARGGMILFDISLGSSGNTDWASDTGLQLVLKGLNTPLQIVAPKEPSWSATYYTYTYGKGEAFDIWGSAILPASIAGPEERVLSGEIRGDFSYPTMAEDARVEIHLPVQIHLVPEGSFHWSSGRNFFYVFASIETVLLVGLWLSLAWSCFRAWLKRRQTPEKLVPNKKRMFQSFLLGFFGSLFVLVWIGLILCGCMFLGTQVLQAGFSEVLISMGLFLVLLELFFPLLWVRYEVLEPKNPKQAQKRSGAG